MSFHVHRHIYMHFATAVLQLGLCHVPSLPVILQRARHSKAATHNHASPPLEQILRRAPTQQM